MEEWKVVESDIDREESKEELSDYEGPKRVKCGNIEGNDGARCVRAIVNENQSVNVLMLEVIMIFLSCLGMKCLLGVLNPMSILIQLSWIN